MAQAKSFVAKLRTVPLVVTCERHSEYPALSNQEEKYLYNLFSEFGTEDTKRANSQNAQRTKGTKIRLLMSRYFVRSIYNHKTDEIIIFYKGRKPTVDDAVVVMGEGRRWLVKKAAVREAVVVIRVPITADTNIDELARKSKLFAVDVQGYPEDEIVIEEELVESELLKLCRQHHVGFPFGLFLQREDLRRIVQPKYKPSI